MIGSPGILSTLLASQSSNHQGKSMVGVASCTLDQLLSCETAAIPGTTIKGVLTIPEYQRPYVWKEKQISRLVTDLINYNRIRDDKSLYYLGSIIIHQDGNKLNIIDGQQRLTTMFLLNSFNAANNYGQVEYRSPLSIHNIKRSHSYLKKVFDHEIADLSGVAIEDIVDFSQINITLVITPSEDLAYTFFETQNTGGIRLSGADIIKSHHLRAIKSKKQIAHQARRWESFSNNKIEDVISHLCKIRYWNNRYWRTYPFFRDERGIKETLIEEFSERTDHRNLDISHYHITIRKEDNIIHQTLESNFKQLRQPLFDGNNFMDYLNEYVELYQILFEKKDDHRISDAFYEFRAKLLHGTNGTIFLKELFEISLITYIGRFGYNRIFEVSLWLYRYIFSRRVSLNRNVREDSIFKFVNDRKLIDLVIQCYSIDELINDLKRFKYKFDENNIEDTQSKGKHVTCLNAYFGSFTTAKQMYKNDTFDRVLIKSIVRKIASQNE
jgi:hypothetical protein